MAALIRSDGRIRDLGSRVKQMVRKGRKVRKGMRVARVEARRAETRGDRTLRHAAVPGFGPAGLNPGYTLNTLDCHVASLLAMTAKAEFP